MALVSSGIVSREQLASAIQAAKTKLGPEAVDVSYRLDEDSTGEPSIFFRITLAGWATKEDTLADVTGQITTTLFDEIQPYENWGLYPYFNFGSEPEKNEQ